MTKILNILTILFILMKMILKICFLIIINYTNFYIMCQKLEQEILEKHIK